MAVIPFRSKPPFETVYEECYDRVYKYVYMLLLHKETAEDIVAETFLAAYKNYDRFDPQRASVITWLTRIAHNNAINLVRSSAYRLRAEMPERDVYGEEDSDLLRLEEENDTILQLYRKLDKKDREFLNMRYAMELRDAEIAEIMGMNTKAVNKRYQRLLKKCRDILGDDKDSAENT